jgi:hypothetical protein
VGVEYKTDLFDAVTMDRLLEHYGSLLEAVVADPEIRLEDIPVPPLTTTPQVLTDEKTPEANFETDSEAWRDRLGSLVSKLSTTQREALERRLRGGS